MQEGSENNLYSNCGIGGFWMLLAGRVRFYKLADVLIGEFGKYEGH